MKTNYITVSPTGAITLSVRAYKVKGIGTPTSRGAAPRAERGRLPKRKLRGHDDANDKFYTDPIGGKGAGTFTYKVCEAGTTTICSPVVSVSF